ncbi:MAG: IS110 family transposase [Bacteroidota bacterium]|nr:IS110 family transposase [Bacteroidota bacterium]
MKKEKVSLEIVNPYAAGIDIGSRSHFVSIGQDANEVREFGVYADDLQELSAWLLENGIQTVAMESTGTYWQNLFSTLQGYGIEVYLVNGKFTKNMKGKKSDVMDCQWIQKLHTMGLLTTSFLPDSTTETIRTYTRHRLNLIQLAADTSKKMQKYLRLLGIRLDVVVNDVCGLTGLAIIKDICNGNLNPESLAEHRHYNCRKSSEEIAKAMHGNGREDYLFALNDEFEMYQILKMKIEKCDKKIELILKNIIENDENKRNHRAEAKPHKRITKNTNKNLDLNQVSFQYFEGIDLMKIEGVSHATVMTIISEIGLEGFSKFNTSKQFASWLRLAPNNKISGGKVLSNQIARGSNRLKIALRNAANCIGNLKETHLSDFFRRVCIKRGRASAVSATARKLAVIIWTMVTKKIQYDPPKEYLMLDQKRKLGLVSRIRKSIAKFDLKPDDLGFTTC